MSPENVHYANMLIGFGAIVLQILSAVALITLIFRPKENTYLSLIKENFLTIGFLISFSAVLVSSFYSEILNYVPCFHCWVQRIFIFPQAFLFAVAWIRKETTIFWYSVPLTIVGLLNALFLNYKYYFNPSSDPCDASGISCVQQLVSEYGGYISIPSLSLTGFAALSVLLLVVYFYKKEN